MKLPCLLQSSRSPLLLQGETWPALIWRGTVTVFGILAIAGLVAVAGAGWMGLL